MREIIYITAGVAATVLILLTWILNGVWKLGKIGKSLTEEKKNSSPFYDHPRRAIIILCILTAVMLTVTEYIGHMQANRFMKIKLVMVLTLTASVSLIDAVKRIIPNKLVLITICARLLLLPLEYFYSTENFKMILFLDGLGFVLGFLVLLLIAIISRQGFGYGDVKLFTAIGITLGISGTYNTLFYSMICTLAAAGYLLAVKKKKKNYRIAFGPFVFLGYLFVLIFQVF